MYQFLNMLEFVLRDFDLRHRLVFPAECTEVSRLDIFALLGEDVENASAVPSYYLHDTTVSALDATNDRTDLPHAHIIE